MMPAEHRYYGEMKQAAVEHLPEPYDWRLYAAQLWQESRFDAYAKSPAGAEGIAQFMPGTWAEVKRELGYALSYNDASVTNAGLAIPAGAYYQNKMYMIWDWPRPHMDRVCLALASYNAGAGNLLKAQKAEGSPSAYRDIIKGLPGITGDSNSHETITYVQKILKYWVQGVTGL